MGPVRAARVLPPPPFPFPEARRRPLPGKRNAELAQTQGTPRGTPQGTPQGTPRRSSARLRARGAGGDADLAGGCLLRDVHLAFLRVAEAGVTPTGAVAAAPPKEEEARAPAPTRSARRARGGARARVARARAPRGGDGAREPRQGPRVRRGGGVEDVRVRQPPLGVPRRVALVPRRARVRDGGVRRGREGAQGGEARLQTPRERRLGREVLAPEPGGPGRVRRAGGGATGRRVRRDPGVEPGSSATAETESPERTPGALGARSISAPIGEAVLSARRSPKEARSPGRRGRRSARAGVLAAAVQAGQVRGRALGRQNRRGRVGGGLVGVSSSPRTTVKVAHRRRSGGGTPPRRSRRCAVPASPKDPGEAALAEGHPEAARGGRFREGERAADTSKEGGEKGEKGQGLVTEKEKEKTRRGRPRFRHNCSAAAARARTGTSGSTAPDARRRVRSEGARWRSASRWRARRPAFRFGRATRDCRFKLDAPASVLGAARGEDVGAARWRR